MSPKGKTWNYPFGSVYLRQSESGKEKWYVYYRFNGKRVRRAVKGALSRADALKVLQLEVADVFRGKYGFKKVIQRITFMSFAEIHLEHTKHKKSWRDDKYRLDATLVPNFGALRLDEITPELIEDFRMTRLRKVKPSTTNRELALLKTMFNRAIDYGYINTNPVKKVKFFSEADNLIERVLSCEEEKRLLEKAAPHLRSIILMVLHMRLRKGEILKVEWKRVDLDHRIIHVVKTKSGKNRVIPINDILCGELLKLKAGRPKGNLIFPFKGIQVSFETARRKAGIQGLRFHDLRHTFATRLVQRGVDLIIVQNLLGHSSVLVTQRYAHSYEEQMRDAVSLLAKLPPRSVYVEPPETPKSQPTEMGLSN